MLSDEAALAGTTATRGRAALVLHQGILIQETQYVVQYLCSSGIADRGYIRATIRDLVAAYEEQSLVSVQREIESRRAKAVIRIAKWRTEQIALMPELAELLESRVACEIEKEVLYMPSDFTHEQRGSLGLTSFGQEEAKLREGMAYDALKSVQVVAKALVPLRERKKKHDHGQNQNTAALKQVVDTERRRDKHIKNYMAARTALMTLGACSGEADDFPELTVADTQMGSRGTHRGAGGSRPTDRWAAGGIAVGRRVMRPAIQSSSAPQLPKPTATVMAPRKAGARFTAFRARNGIKLTEIAAGKVKGVAAKLARRVATEKPMRKAGWLWTFGKMGKMTKDEMKAWSDEGKLPCKTEYGRL
jgi:hypothetical protein